ncbi:MAG: Rieske (2Fe-2S) protein [Pseudomonadota bacterium]
MLYLFSGVVLAYPALSFITYRKPTKKTVIFPKEEQASGVHYKEGVYLIKESEKLVALSARCTHLGCSLNYDQPSQRFLCPCHGSIFDRQGRWISGPAKKQMQTLSITIREKGDISVDIEI